MKVSLKKAFSILDGRLSTEIGDVYEMLNYIFDANFMTHQLPTAMRKLKELNPKWFSDGVKTIDGLKANYDDDFIKIIGVIDNDFNNFEIELGKCSAEIPFGSGLEMLGKNAK